MTSKTLVIAAAAAAAAALSGCATNLPSSYQVTASGAKLVNCTTTLNCAVTLPHYWWWTLVYPDEIDVMVPPGQQVTITWTIQGADGTTFNPLGGINLKDRTGQSVFSCNPGVSNPQAYVCSNNINGVVTNLDPNGTYTYAIKTKGIFSGWDIDPVIKNGAS